MTRPLVGVAREAGAAAHGAVVGLAPARAWRWVGWFGLLLTVQASGDLALTFYPLQLGSREWEFGTIAAALSGLPLWAVGIAAMLASALALRKRPLVLALGLLLALSALVLAGLLVVFLLDVPLALAASQGVAALGVKKAIARTILLGTGFALGSGLGATGAFRALREG